MFQAVESLTDSDGPGSPSDVPAAKKKRKRSQRKKREPLDSETAVRCILGKPCKCQLRCMTVFGKQQMFEKLCEFRGEWVSLHKLDQDQVVPQWNLVFVLFCITKTREFCLLYI